MTLETRLRLSVIQAELFEIARRVDGSGGRIVRYAAHVLNLLRDA